MLSKKEQSIIKGGRDYCWDDGDCPDEFTYCDLATHKCKIIFVQV